MTAKGEADCRHCGKTIRYSSPTGWTHSDTGSSICTTVKRLAEPKR